MRPLCKMPNDRIQYLSMISETAINIGYSCRLLTDEMEDVFIVDGETEETVKKQMTDFLKAIKDHKAERHSEESVHMQNGGVTFNGSAAELNVETPGLDFALVINGHSLVHSHYSYELFFMRMVH